MFAHIREMNHYSDAKEGGEADTGKQDAEPITDDEGGEAEGEDEEDYDEESGEYEEEPPTDFRAWIPFSEYPYDSSEGNELLKQYLEAFNATSDLNTRSDIAIKHILKPFLDQHRPKFSDWPDKELKHIFQDAALRVPPRDHATRYFFNQKVGNRNQECPHFFSEDCWCYFEATASAGIPGLLQPGRGIRQDRKACIAFMHKLVTQFLIILAESTMKFWENDEKWTLHGSIKMSNPSTDDDDDYLNERTRYLLADSDLQDLALNKINKRRTENDLLFLRLCGTLGRRMLALRVCLVGDGLHFVKKKPIRFWDIASLGQDLEEKGQDPESWIDHHLKSSTRPNVDKPLYPTRVINTRTYEFEDDALLYHNNYAILSHTWTTKGKEIEYPDAEAFLLHAKKNHLQGLVDKLKNNKWSADPERGRKNRGEDIKALEDDLDELVKRLPQKKQMTLKQMDDAPNFGKRKLAKAIAVARAQKFTYLWVDSCCIDKKTIRSWWKQSRAWEIGIRMRR
jgi:hypothetical protein